MTNAHQENARMLAAILGIGEDEAAGRLNRTVLVTVGSDVRDRHWAEEIIALLALTVDVAREPIGTAHAELIVGMAEPRTSAPRLHAAIDALGATISAAPAHRSSTAPHPFLAAIAACPAVAAALHLVIDDPALPSVRLPLQFQFVQLGLPARALDRELDITGGVLVGAGAVGHGFLRALRHLPVRGTLPVVDPKSVGAGNLNRCTYLRPGDVGHDKAGVLANRAQPDFPELSLTPFVEEFRIYCKRHGPPPTAIVTVDSRRARRSIQSELPGRVIDASTTDVRAVVVHSHRQPTAHACLSCIYRHVPEENLRERAIANGLGIDLEMVKQGFISDVAAAAIAAAHYAIESETIVGMAYDSLFKQLCAAQTLLTPDSRQVLAPFAFVSSLAGALLVIELLRSDARIEASNYWTVDPWGMPINRRRVLRPRVADCEFCSNSDVDTVARQLWARDVAA
jgi:hypothetical protein